MTLAQECFATFEPALFCFTYVPNMFIFPCFKTPSRFTDITPRAVFTTNFVDYIGLFFDLWSIFRDGKSCCRVLTDLLETLISYFRRTRIKDLTEPLTWVLRKYDRGNYRTRKAPELWHTAATAEWDNNSKPLLEQYRILLNKIHWTRSNCAHPSYYLALHNIHMYAAL